MADRRRQRLGNEEFVSRLRLPRNQAGCCCPRPSRPVRSGERTAPIFVRRFAMAVDMFMKIGALKGESKDHKHKESIDVLAWSWGMSNSGSAHVGGGAGSGKVNVQDLSITKYVDASSTALMLACCKGTHYDDAHLVVRKAGDSPVEYIKIDLSEVLITAVSTGG